MSDSITQLAEPCWVLKREPEGRHWQTRASALECAEPEDIEQLPAPCWVGECAGCGEDMGDDDRFSQVHGDTRSALEGYARDFDWLVKDGELFHGPDCAEMEAAPCPA